MQRSILDSVCRVGAAIAVLLDVTALGRLCFTESGHELSKDSITLTGLPTSPCAEKSDQLFSQRAKISLTEASYPLTNQLFSLEQKPPTEMPHS